jgi:hypothetical protein
VDASYCFTQLVAAWRTPPFPCNAHLTTFCGFRSFFYLFAISPRRAKLGGMTRGMRSAGTPPPAPAAGAPPEGPWQEPKWAY